MHHKELPIPPAATEGQVARELARVWAAKGAQHVSIATDAWQDPAAWGIMLVDLAKHVADAYAQIQGVDAASALERIREGFDAEWDHPTCRPHGGLQDE